MPVKPKRTTLRDVARAAEVSVATVSRVLNKSDSVSSETRDRVTQAIDTLGFVPSAAARSLNSGRTRTIGALVPTLDHSLFARYLNALEHRLSEEGYALVVAVTGGIADVEEQKAHGLLDMGAEGLIISGKAHSDGFDALVQRFGVPALITSYYDEKAKYPTIGYDNTAIAEHAMRYLQSLGHRHIAVIHGPTDVNDRFMARIDGLMRLSDDVEIGLLNAPLGVAGGAAATRQILATEKRPTAIFCLSDVQALGALFELQRQGVSVPGDMALMGFDNLEWSSVSQPSITSINLPAARMGMAAADAMIAWITSGERAQPQMLDAEIVARTSTEG